MNRLRPITALLVIALAACSDGKDTTTGPLPPAAPTTGTLQLTVSGLPAGVNGAVRVEGAGVTQSVTQSTSLALAPGSYTVTASAVTTADLTGYAPAQATQSVALSAGATATVTVTYASTGVTTLNVSRIVDSIRVAFDLPALAGAIVTTTNATYALGVSGSRRITGGTPATVTDLWHLGSNFKAFTAMLAAIAVDRGRLSWNTTIAESFPELSSSIRAEYRTVTLRELLSHTSGMVRDAVGSAITGTTRTAQRNAVTAWAVQQAPITTRGRYNYTNIGYIIGGAMVERALGVSFEEAVATNVFARLGISDAGWGPQATTGSATQPVAHRLVNGQWVMAENFDNPAVYASAGGAHMSIGSWSRFLQEILRMEAGTAALASLNAERETTMSITNIGGADWYGMGWLITSRTWAGGRTLNHSGSNTGNESVTWLAPLRGFGVLAVTNSYDGSTPSRSSRALDALVGRLIAFRETGR